MYAFEYKPGFDNGYITWVNDGKPSWTLIAQGMDADPLAEIGKREVTQEPMVSASHHLFVVQRKFSISRTLVHYCQPRAITQVRTHRF